MFTEDTVSNRTQMLRKQKKKMIQNQFHHMLKQMEVLYQMRQNRQSSLCSHQLKRHKIYGLLKLLFKCCCFREIFSKRRSSIDIVQWDFKMINLWKISALILNMVSATIVQSILEASFLKYLMFYYGLCKERQNKGGLLLKKKKKDICLTDSGPWSC